MARELVHVNGAASMVRSSESTGLIIVDNASEKWLWDSASRNTCDD